MKLRFAPRLLLACVGMSAIAVADGSGGGSLRLGPGFVNDAEGARWAAIARVLAGLEDEDAGKRLLEYSPADAAHILASLGDDQVWARPKAYEDARAMSRDDFVRAAQDSCDA